MKLSFTVTQLDSGYQVTRTQVPQSEPWQQNAPPPPAPAVPLKRATVHAFSTLAEVFSFMDVSVGEEPQ